MLEFMLILLVVFSIAAVQTRFLRQAVIYLGLFSLALSVVYFMYHAPDVALAEAVIGTTISTVLFIVALQKYKIFTIYYRVRDEEGELLYPSEANSHLQQLFAKFCNKQELEPEFIYSHEKVERILSDVQFALIVEHREEGLMIYGHEENMQLEHLAGFLQEEEIEFSYRIVPVKEKVIL